MEELQELRLAKEQELESLEKERKPVAQAMKGFHSGSSMKVLEGDVTCLLILVCFTHLP